MEEMSQEVIFWLEARGTGFRNFPANVAPFVNWESNAALLLQIRYKP
ncbi:hypothetical protein C4J89_2015 [Pseudomonas sp. R4-35-07]|nr:hypothetical protein C4J92_2000 [Pseudomonas sp. R3-18-08]AZF26125.1 hypothetical protein C4J90_1952 [Pseudomonas sp. R2-60-08W]AZF31490.1 hypothetical protein C4J89_2015 [Pseudomonas sp. R4-35-07]AZF36768.1 hypothetical protein C4J88_1985 [Pseudomonas sp. R4-39-08]AZF52434.1 hypothetical protein C4J85_1949 [Pseudomonas sp. R4-34-07]MDQ0980264.1 hypothetical protein [Pseudomonas synxantha]